MSNSNAATGPVMARHVIHYHGTPVWGNAGAVHRQAVSDAGAFVSFARMDQMQASFIHAARVGLDNGAFSAWKRGIKIDWQQFYKRVEMHIDDPKLEFFVIPDVVEGGEEDNDQLIRELPAHLKEKAAPVWHLHESIERLIELCREWPRVCFGSSGEFAVIRTQQWHTRMTEAFRAIYIDHRFSTHIHGLRMLDGRVLGKYPLHTADSTNLACNIPKFREKYPAITRSIETADYCKGLSDPEVKRLVLQGRCAILKAAIEKVAPPSVKSWVDALLEKENARTEVFA